MKPRTIYFAAPLFSRAEREYNLELSAKLEALGYLVFLPQRDGFEMSHKKYEGLTPTERDQMIFSLDTQKVEECDIFFFVLDGRVPDEGACFELGFAFYQKSNNMPEKKIIGLHTDSRGAFESSRLNAMVACAFDEIFLSETKLLEHLAAV